MSEFPAALPHGDLEELFDGVFFVTGTMRAEFFGSPWQFSRNMTVVREGDQLTVINAVRLSDEGLAKLDALGKVTNVVRLGAMHGIDDPFYVDRYKEAHYWALPGMPGEGPEVDKELSSDSLPASGCTLFTFETTKVPEALLIFDRDGGVAVACDALQNWAEPDEFFDEDTIGKMRGAGFFAPANVGPAWIQVSGVKGDDFARLKQLSFKHALCGHGAPLRDTASEAYGATFARLFSV